MLTFTTLPWNSPPVFVDPPVPAGEVPGESAAAEPETPSLALLPPLSPLPPAAPESFAPTSFAPAPTRADDPFAQPFGVPLGTFGVSVDATRAWFAPPTPRFDEAGSPPAGGAAVSPTLGDRSPGAPLADSGASDEPAVSAAADEGEAAPARSGRPRPMSSPPITPPPPAAQAEFSIETDADPLVQGEAAGFYVETTREEPRRVDVEWDFSYDSREFDAYAGVTGMAVSHALKDAGDVTVAARLTDLATSEQEILTLDCDVLFARPNLSISGDLETTAGAGYTFPLSVDSLPGVGPIDWWVTRRGEPWPAAPTHTGQNPTFTPDAYGYYDYFVETTDKQGLTASASGSVYAWEPDPNILITVTDGGFEGKSAVFTATEIVPSGAAAVSIYADWLGDGTFVQLDKEDWTAPQATLFQFGHTYDDDPAGGGDTYTPRFRVENEAGKEFRSAATVRAANVAPVATIYAGQQFATKASSGEDIFSLRAGEPLNLGVNDPSGADRRSLRYTWVVDGQTLVTDRPYLAMPDFADGDPGYSPGRSHTVTVYVEDKDGGRSDVVEGRVVIFGGEPTDSPVGGFGVGGLHATPTVGSGLKGGFSLGLKGADGLGWSRGGSDENFNPYGYQATLSTKLAAGDPLTVGMKLTPASAQLVANAAKAEYDYEVRVYDISKYPIGEGHYHTYLPGESFRQLGAGRAVSIASVPSDREVRVQMRVAFWDAAGKSLGGAGNYQVVARTPNTLSLYERFSQLWSSVVTTAQAFGSVSGQLISALLSEEGAETLFNRVLGGVTGALKQFWDELQSPGAGYGLLFNWLNPYGTPPDLAGVDFSSKEGALAFLLQVGGLDWEGVQSMMLDALGDGNLDGLEDLADAVGTGDADVSGMKSLVAFLGTAGGLGFDLAAVQDDVLKGLNATVADAGLQAGRQLAGKFVPGLGAVQSIVSGFGWLLGNPQQLEAILAPLRESLPALLGAGGGADAAFQAKVLQGLKAGAGAGLSLAAAQLGLGKFADKVRGLARAVPERFRAAIRKFVGDKATARKGGAQNAAKDGKIARQFDFQYENKAYTLWVAKTGDGPAQIRLTEGQRLLGVLKPEHFVDGGGEQPSHDVLRLQQVSDALVRKANNRFYPGQPRREAGLVGKLRAMQRQVESLLQEVKEACQAGACKLLGLGCFAAGTALWTPDGYRAVETLKPGDRVYSRSEHDADAPLVVREVEEVFTRFAAVLELTVAGEVIRTTGEHPFWADRAERGLGWARACELAAGDRLRAASGEWLTVGAVEQTESWEAVYNCRVAEDHTYFVGRDEWGFSLWAHNAYVVVQQLRVSPQYTAQYGDFNHFTVQVRTDEGMCVTTHEYGTEGSPAIVAYYTQLDASALTQVGKDWKIPLNNERARATLFYMYGQIGPHGIYNQWWNSCAVYVHDVLTAAGVAGLPQRPNEPGDVRAEKRNAIALYRALMRLTGHSNASGFQP